jgi:GMP synthase-like glutamine amidotransferase
MNIHILQHVVFESPGMITGWAKVHNHSLTYTLLFEKKISWPAINDFDMLIILGGPMGVNEEDRFDWLKTEKVFIRQAIAANKVILGICLGCQLLAEALDAKVYPNPEKEIGFFPVIKTVAGKTDKAFSLIPETWNVFHWHGDTFDLPDGASHLFASAACSQQVFRKEKFTGIQFHPEVDPGLLKSMITNEKHELIKAVYVQTEEEILDYDVINISEQNKVYLYDLLTKLANELPVT